MILRSAAINGTRIRDWPVDTSAAALHAGRLQLMVQYNVFLHLKEFQTSMCRVTEQPLLCDYQFPGLLQSAAPEEICSNIAAALM